MAWTPFTRADHDRSALRYTSDLTDREFARIAPLLPGRPRRGRKRRVDTLGLLLRGDVHSAGIQDRDGTTRLFDRLTARFPFLEVFFADSAYAGEKVAHAAPRPVEIVRRADTAKGFEVLPKRWIVERTLARITANRRMARDFERHAETAIAFIHIAMIKLMTRRLPDSLIRRRTLKYDEQDRCKQIACLFPGSGANISACLEQLKQKSKIVAYECFVVGRDEWVVGLIVSTPRRPEDDALR